MGNVLASGTGQPSVSPVSPNLISSAPPPPPPTLGFPPNYGPPGGISEVKTSSDDKTPSIEQDSTNPGTFEDLHKKCKDIFPVVFEGAKVLVNKSLSNHFQVSHTINLSTVSQSGYRFGATYVGTRQLSPSEVYPVLLGDIDPSGNLNAQIIHLLGQKTRLKFAAQIQNNKYAVTQFSFDYKGNDYTASFGLGNPDVINMSGVAIGHYLQTVTPNLALGAELIVQSGRNVPGGVFSVLSAAGRYSTKDAVISGTLGQHGLHLCYYQRASEQVQIGVELEANSKAQESVATFGYQIDLPKADLCFRGMVDSNWTIGAVLEKKLQPLPFNFALSATMNHNKSQFRLGCGLIIG